MIALLLFVTTLILFFGRHEFAEILGMVLHRFWK
jgi:hypothetical protein